ncbi:MAG: prepilin-type N-terminal cleavage/methylation domain-containing protein [Candidatus Colwellbacteria bacterium]|nr:prepilin-type N-terminal cleavage/methylation domain-containing protein [Candidatus Colwellbacteria bacterium]
MTRREQGFTLVELLVYAAIFAIVAGILSTIFFVIVNSQKKQAVSGEVVQQLNFVLGTIQRLTGESSLVEMVYEGSNPSSTCATFCTLKLRRTDPTKDPTVVSSDANGVYLKEGSGPVVTLTNNKVLINNLKFTKNELPGAHAVVQISTSFSYNSNNPAFAVTKAIESAIARVNAATFDADLLPNQDNAFDIGQVSPDLRWRNGRFSGALTIGGDVGIGTASPATKLEVNRGATAGNILRLAGGSGPSNYTWSIDSNNSLALETNYFVIKNDNRIGIGTATPSTALHIKKDTSPTVILEGPNTDTSYGALDFYTGGFRRASIQGGRFDTTGDFRGKLLFFTMSSGNNFLERMRIDDAGRVGIGTTNPGALLDVNGDLDVTGVLQIKGTQSACDSSQAGVIRFQANHFYGCDGSNWKQLDN